MQGTANRILLTGATGQVGGEILRQLAHVGVEAVAPPRSAMDLAQPETVRRFIRSVQPRWIVNPGAYTAVDKAESEPDLAYAINAESVAVMGQEAKALGAAVIHFSTDYVFNGEGTAPYVETDVTGPQSVYGASKLAGEQALAASGAAHLILRTSWVYGPTGKNFLRTILKLAREREALRIVADQHGAPTWARDLALFTTNVISRCEDDAGRGQIAMDEVVGAVSGTYHLCNTGETTWHGFAAEAVRQMREREPGTSFATLEPIPTTEYPTPARRPSNSRLSCAKVEEVFGWKMQDWKAALIRVLDELEA